MIASWPQIWQVAPVWVDSNISQQCCKVSTTSRYVAEVRCEFRAINSYAILITPSDSNTKVRMGDQRNINWAALPSIFDPVDHVTCYAGSIAGYIVFDGFPFMEYDVIHVTH
jgi:hypothetical protein